MKSSKLKQILWVTILVMSMMASLIVPAPAYAQGPTPGEPPPPGAPVNDLGMPNSPKTSPPDATSPGADPSQPPDVMSSRAPALAAALLLSGPAMFCPEGVLFGGPGCQYQATIEDALAYAQVLPNGSGTVYVQNTYTGLAATLQVDQASFSGAKPVYMDLLGGITDMSTGAYTLGGTFTTLGQNIAIQNFTGGDPAAHGGPSLSLTDFILNVNAPTGISIEASEHILLNYVQVNQTGAVAGISVTNSTDVTIQNSQVKTTGTGAGILAGPVTGLTLDTVNIQSDLGDGLKISASSAINLNKVTAKSKSRGALLSSNTGSLTISNSQFSNNLNSGLEISHQGNVTLDNVIASGNGNYGVLIDNTPVNGSGSITVGHSAFTTNVNDGLHISALGQVTLNTVTASFNGFYGAYLDNCLFNAGLNSCTGSNNLSVTGNAGSDLSLFNQNGSLALFLGDRADGLFARSAGDVLVDHVNALNNSNGSGANILAEGAAGTLAVSESLFMWNGLSFPAAGLSAASANAINLSNVTSLQNGASGAELLAAGDASVTGGEFNDNGIAFLGSGGFVGGNGIDIISLGNVSLDTIITVNNQAGIVDNSGMGVFVENCILSDSGCQGSGFVHVTGLSTAGNIVDGLQVTSGGDITLNNVHTDVDTPSVLIIGNGGDGANLLTLATDSVIVENSSFIGNLNDGLHIETPGSITLNRIYAADNGFNGTYLNNCLDLGDGCTGVGSVTVTGGSLSSLSEFSFNAADGLFIASSNTIDLNLVEAEWNLNNGVTIDNCTDIGSGCTTSGDVILQNSNFRNNLLGLQVNAGGIAILVEDHSDENFGAGADILSGYHTYIEDSSFNFNMDYGLNVQAASGGIFLNFVEASGNQNFGANLIATDPAGGVSIFQGTFNDNGSSGLYVLATGRVTLNQVTASRNAEFGAQIDTTGPVIVTNSTFLSNQGAGTGGLGIFTNGDITLNNVTANGNAGDGVFLSSTNGQVVVTNSKFNHNGRYGLELAAGQGSTLVNVTACNNALGPLKRWSGGLTNENFDTCSGNTSGEVSLVEPPAYPCQIIRVYKDFGKGSGILDSRCGTTFLYLDKQPDNQPDKELGRAVLPPGTAPGGTLASFVALADGSLLATLPNGDTFLAPGFSLSFTAPDGSPILALAGTLTVQFSLPPGFSLPAGKKLVIQFADSTSRTTLETYTAGDVIYAFANRPGSFVLAVQ